MLRTVSSVNSFVLNGCNPDFILQENEETEFLKFLIVDSNEVEAGMFFSQSSIANRFHDIPYVIRYNFDPALREVVTNGGVAVLQGRSGSGKTRAIYEAVLSSGRDFQIIFPKLESQGIESFPDWQSLTREELEVLLERNREIQYLFVIDGIEEYFGFSGLYELIEKASEIENLTLILTGHPKHFLKVPFLKHLLEEVEAVTLDVNSLSNDDVDCLTEHYDIIFGKSLSPTSLYNGTVGSLLHRRGEFEAFYTPLPYKSAARKVLWAIKSIHYITRRAHIRQDALANFAEWQSGVSPTETEEVISDLIAKKIVYAPYWNAEVVEVDTSLIMLVSKGYLNHLNNSQNISRKVKREEEILYLTKNLFDQFSAAFPRARNAIGNALLRRVSHYRRINEMAYDFISGKCKIEAGTYRKLLSDSDSLKEIEAWDTKWPDKFKKDDLERKIILVKWSADKVEDLLNELVSSKEATAAKNPVLLLLMLEKATSISDFKSINDRFAPKVLLEIPTFYYQRLLNRIKTFGEGYEILNLLPESLRNKLGTDFINQVIKLEGGEFQHAFKLYELLIREDDTQRSVEILRALAAKAKLEKEAVLVFNELNKVNSEKITEGEFTELLNKHKSILRAQRWYRNQLDKSNTPSSLQQALIAARHDPELRAKAFEEWVGENGNSLQDYFSFLNHESVKLDKALQYYRKMIEAQINPDLKILELLVEKYIAEPTAREEHKDHIVEVYEDARILIQSNNEGTLFNRLFLLFNEVLVTFEEKLDLFKLGARARIEVTDFVGELISCATSYIDSTRILNLYFELGVEPSPEICLRLIRVFNEVVDEEDFRLSLILFIKDIKNCGLSNEKISRIYLSIIKKKEYRITADDLVDRLKGVGVDISQEVRIEQVFLQLDQKQGMYEEPFKIIIRDAFDGSLNISPSALEALVQRSSNYRTALLLYQVVETPGPSITIKTFKGLLGLAKNMYQLKHVEEVLYEAVEYCSDALVPLLSSIESSKRYEALRAEFLLKAAVNPEGFSKKQDQKYWLRAVGKAKETIMDPNVADESILQTLREADSLSDVILLFKLFSKKGIRMHNSDLIQILLEISRREEQEKMYNFFKKKLHYLTTDIVSELLDRLRDPSLREELYGDFEANVRKEVEEPTNQYRELVYPCYRLLSGSVTYAFAAKALTRLEKLHTPVNLLLFDEIKNLIQTPSDVKDFISLSAKRNMELSVEVIESIFIAEAPQKLWSTLRLLNDKEKFVSKPYNVLAGAAEADRNEDFYLNLLTEIKDYSHYPVVAKFMLNDLKEANEKLQTQLTAQQVPVEVIKRIFVIFEQMNKSLSVEKIYWSLKLRKNTMKGPHKNSKKIPESELKNHMKDLFLLSSRPESLQDVVTWNLKLSSLNPEIITRAIEKRKDFSAKLSFMKFIVAHYGSLPTVTIGDGPMLDLIDSMTNNEEYGRLRDELLDHHGDRLGLELSPEVSSQLSMRALAQLTNLQR